MGFPINDEQYYENIITSVEEYPDSWDIGTECGHLNIPKKITPKSGTTARFYGKGMGYSVRGVFLDGEEVYYKTEAQADAEHKEWVTQRKQKQKEEAIAKRSETEKRISALPQVFQDRIKGFMSYNDEFESEFLPYELFVCEQAVLYATTLKTSPAVASWAKGSYEEQKILIPAMSEEHSGNTFGASCQLACLYLDAPDLVEKQHGALCPLVGCKDYGCFSVRQKS